MAKVVKVKSVLKSNKNKTFLIAVICLLLSVFSGGYGVGVLIAVLTEKKDIHIVFPIILIALAFILLVIFFAFKKKFAILNAGVRGESATLDVLKKLPKDYTVITNPVLLNRGVSMELDFVVVGKNGVFIIESKNLNGVLKGKIDDSQWTQVKHGKNNKVYEKRVGNPLKQAHRQGRRMLEMFRDFDITADVFSIVYFTDTRTELKLADDTQTDVTIFKNPQSLVDFIVTAKGRHTVNSSELAKIIRFFKR